MSNLEKCEDILLSLEDGARTWGKYIDDFVKYFSQLDKCQIEYLIGEFDAEIRYDFLYQVFGHVRREFHNLSDEEKRKVLNQFYLLVILENCDFDYRENILRANIYSEVTKDYSDMKAKEWGKVSHLASDKLKKYLEGY